MLRYFNTCGTVQQRIADGTWAVKLTRLRCHRFRANDVRLWLSVVTYCIGNSSRWLVLPQRAGHWSLTGLQQRLVKAGARPIKHTRHYCLLLV